MFRIKKWTHLGTLDEFLKKLSHPIPLFRFGKFCHESYALGLRFLKYMSFHNGAAALSLVFIKRDTLKPNVHKLSRFQMFFKVMKARLIWTESHDLWYCKSHRNKKNHRGVLFITSLVLVSFFFYWHIVDTEKYSINIVSRYIYRYSYEYSECWDFCLKII